MNQPGRSKGNAQTIEQKGEGDILHHLRVAAAADVASNGKGAQTVRQDNDVRRLDRNIRAAAHRDSDIGLHQSGGIVDAIADHRHSSMGRLKLSHDRGLVLRQHFSVHLVYADFQADALCCALVVAGDEDRFQPRFAQRGDCGDRIRPKCIAQGDNAQRAPVPRNGDHGASRRLQTFDGSAQWREVDIPVGEEARASDDYFPGFDTRDDTFARKCLE